MKKLALAMVFVASNAHAGTQFDAHLNHTDFPVCVDHAGVEASYVNDQDESASPSIFGMIGVRYRNQQDINDPAIFYDPAFVSDLSPMQFDFVMAHECYHLSSGDAHSAYSHYLTEGKHWTRREMQDFEDRADCYAVQSIVDAHGKSVAIDEIYEFFSGLARGNKLQNRIANTRQCYEDSVSEENLLVLSSNNDL